MNEYYGVATTPTTDYLAHYGVKGMKWGVRKALAKGGIAGAKALAKQYKKDAKHLARLEKRATSGKKYAKRAAALGAGAAVAGGVAGFGPKKISAGLINVNGKMINAMGNRGPVAKGLGIANRGLAAVNTWSKGTEASKALIGLNGRMINAVGNKGVVATGLGAANRKLNGLSNNAISRIGAAGIGTGLAAGAGYNAYRALTAKKNAERAATFRKEMNKAYNGTKYANGYKPTKKRRR